MNRKHYLLGALIISFAFIIQPFSLLFVQSTIAPLIAPFFIGQNNENMGSQDFTGKTISTNNLKIKGNIEAPIYLVEFSDYECPFCARFHSTPQEIIDASGGKVAWVWKHFPLIQIHPNAKPASIAAECVFKLAGNEKFWQYSDTLIANQTKLTDSLFKSEAAKLGVNAQAFATCLKDPSVAAIIDNDLSEGENYGVNGTPSTFIVKNEGGQLTILENVSGALPKSTVESAVQKYSN